MMQKIRWMAVFLLTGLVMFIPPLTADEGDAVERGILVIEPTVVTAGRIEEKKSDISTNVTIYTAEDLEKASIIDLGDVLLKEGFQIREYPNSTISVGVRGFRTDTHGNDLASHVLILIDGRRAGTGNLAKISMDNVARIELIRGPGSVQYGASAMGGVINIITRQGEGPFTASVDGVVGSWDYRQAGVAMSGKIQQFDYSVSASRASQDDYDTPEGQRYQNTGFDAKERVNVNAGFTFMPDNRVGFSVSDYKGDEIGNPGYLSDNDPDDYVDHGISSFDLFYDGQALDGFLIWNMRYFQGKDEYETHDPVLDPSKTYWRDTDSRGFQGQLTAKWHLAHVTAGVDWTEYGISNSYSVAGRENTYENPAAFVMAKTRLLDDRLILTAGGRFDDYEVTSDTGKNKEDDNWSLSCGAVYKFSGHFSVRANYAEAFRMPTAEELFMYDDYSAWGYGIWSGNENLKPESSRTYEAGFDYRRGSFSGHATYFHTDFDDKISYQEIGGGVTQYMNAGSATLEGIEGGLQFDIGAVFGWDWEIVPYGTFTTFLTYEDDDTGNDLQYTPEWSASYGIRVSREESGFAGRLNFVHYGEQKIMDYEGTGATSIGPDTVADLSVSKRLYDFKTYGRLTLKAEIANLFDTEYELVQGYVSPARTFYIGLNYTY